MPYAAPTIGPQGASIPSYSDIKQYLLDAFRSVFGQDVYLDTDSAWYQFIAIISLQANDVLQFGEMIYNSRSPVTAVAGALDALGKVCGGITRLSASYSTVALTVAGTGGTVITNGSALDTAGNSWLLPGTVTIPPSGSIIVIATAANPGAVAAQSGEIAIIATPNAGWISVANASAAIIGTPVETDSQYRARMAISQALPSRTMLSATTAALAATSGVTRFNVIENPTGATDSNGTPAHSISCVVEGATDAAVALAIWQNRGIGALTNGTNSVNVTDPNTQDITAIGFSRPSYVPIYVNLNVHPLNGYTTATAVAIKTAIVNYLNSLQIGESLTISALYAAALSVMPSLSLPMFSVQGLTAGISLGAMGASDIAISYNQVVQGLTANVTITPV